MIRFRLLHAGQRALCSAEGDAGAGAGGAAAGAGAGTAGAGDPWYQPYVPQLDKETLGWLDGKKFADPVMALKSGALADKMARERNVIAKPDPAKLGEWEGWQALGYDPDRAKYGAGIKPPKMPNGAQHDAALMDDFVSLAHEQKIPPAMAEKLYHGLTEKVNGRLSTLASNGVKATEAMESKLRDEWGTDYDQKTELARRAARAFGVGADDTSELARIFGGDEEGAKGSVRLLKLFADIGAKLGEGNLVTADGLGGAAGMTPASAEAELRRLEADQNWLKAFTDSRHPQHKDYKAQWNRLTSIAAKGQAKG